MDIRTMLALFNKIKRGTPGGGKADDVPATINGNTPAALSEGEYVIPAEVVSILGDGNTLAGSRILDQFVEAVRGKKGPQAPPTRNPLVRKS